MAVPYRQFPKRRQPLVIGGSVSLNGQIRISLNPNLNDGWAEPVNQPLRSRVPKRQQPRYPAYRFLVLNSATNSTTLTGQIRIASNPAVNPSSWIHPANQPLVRRAKRIEGPSKAESSVNEPPYISYWVHPVNQPFKSRTPRRQQPVYPSLRFINQLTSQTALNGQIRVSSNPSLNAAVWKQPTNQPLRNRMPKRQQPFPINKRFLITGTNTTTLTGQVRIATNPATNPTSWLHAPQQPLKARIPKRQEPFAINRRFLVTTSNQTTLTGQVRVSPNPSLEPIWKQPTNEPLKGRIPKRQQPAYPTYRFLVLSTATNSTTLTGQLRIAPNPATDPAIWIHPTQQPQRYNKAKKVIEIPGGQISSITEAPYVSYWKQPVNQPLRHRWLKRQQVNHAVSFVSALTGIFSTTLTGQIRVSPNPSIEPIWKHPTEEPLKSRVPKRQQPAYPFLRYLVTVGNATTITGQVRVGANPATNASIWVHPTNQPRARRTKVVEVPGKAVSTSATMPLVSQWIHQTNQPLRNRVLKRQQPFYPVNRFLVSATNSTALNGQIRVSINPATNGGWKQPVNQPWPRKVRRIEITGGELSSVTEAPYVSYWKHPTEQPLRYRYLRRQQPKIANVRFLFTGVGTTTINGQIRIAENPATNPESWIQPANQFIKARTPRRQQPFAIDKRFLVTVNNQTTITGQIRVSLNASLVSGYKQPVNEPLTGKFYVKRRLQPPSAKLRPLITASPTTTLTGQLRISANPATQLIWKHLTEQLPRSRTPKRQMPFYPSRRFLITVANTTAITGQLRIAFNPSSYPSWIHPVNQPLRKRIPKRQQPQYPSRRFLPTISNATTITGQLRVSGNPAINPFWKQPVNQPQVNRNRKLTAMRYRSTFKMITLLGSHPTTPIILTQNDEVAYLGMDGSQPSIVGQRDTIIHLGQNDDAASYEDDDNNELFL